LPNTILLNDIWPKELLSARVGSLVRRSLYVGEFGRLFIPSSVGIVTAVEEEDDEIVYDVLFFVDEDGEQGGLHTLRLYSEDLTLVAI